MKKFVLGNKTGFYIGLLLLIIIVLIKLATFYPGWVEAYYSTGLYPHIAKFYRLLFGWFPLSIGDILYLAVMVYLAVKMFRLFILLRYKRWDLLKIKTGYARPFFILATVYILFNISWGLNYNRLGIAHQLQIQPIAHTTTDLQQVTAELVRQLNHYKKQLIVSGSGYPVYQQVFLKSDMAFEKAAGHYPFLNYDYESIKRSIYGRAGIYMGFLGYYNPFTGESQLNLTQPPFMLPFVTCHEVAHQLGYASESEANFVGYLVASQADDPLFRYSAYFDMFNYANKELRRLDTALANHNLLLLDHDVRQDIQAMKEYYKKSDNFLEDIVKLFYDQYLKANQQVNGVKSYNEVVAWLVAYYKKHGKL